MTTESSKTVTELKHGWKFRQTDQSADELLPVSRFPTNIHLDLMHHNIIPDPFVGTNEEKVQWVGEKSWTYETRFASTEKVGSNQIDLVFAGLDTHAAVLLNGVEILKTENMFIAERVDVTSVVKGPGQENHLEIRFDSTWTIGKQLKAANPDHRWIGWNGDVSRLAVRKAQYQYGWDWGPKLMTCGPWRAITLETYSARISDLHNTTDVDHSLESASVTAEASIEGSDKASEVVFRISLNSATLDENKVQVRHGKASVIFNIQKPVLWYPHTYGDQPLYLVSAQLFSSKGHLLDESSKRIGLRAAKLVQRDLDGQSGKSFFFEINNVPVFCGGSDWIPADNFVPRITAQHYRDSVRLAAEGNQIMIRVWGGGIYEEPAFYEACDEYGILVWQDFMFACGNYPANKEMLHLIRREAEYNVKRLRHHPCLVLWAGNNEDYWIRELNDLDYVIEDKDPENWLKTNFPARYIYEKLLPEVVNELSPYVNYHPGSPYSGALSTDDKEGDIHQWNVWHGKLDRWQNYDQLGGRFVSEFGMEGFPHIKTIEAFLPLGAADPDRFPQSRTIDFHNRSDDFERRIATYLGENLRYQPSPLERYVYATQLMQAESVASAYRLWKREWKGPGREFCAGALVWQTNDCWPVTSWAIVDYYLRPKPAYYAVKRELEALTVGVKRTGDSAVVPSPDGCDGDMLEIWATNLSVELSSVTVELRAWDAYTGRQTHAGTVTPQLLRLEPNRSTEIAKIEVPVQTKKAGLERQTVVAVYLLDEDGRQVARHVNWPEPLKYLHLKRPERLEIGITEGRDAVYIRSDVPIKGLVLESDDEDVWFCDNLVDVVPGETLTLKATGLKGGDEFRTEYYE
ncbi:unnamed protein product [Clonostachys byssicola]|uniref:Beta-mannosidase B n=1 Tax=Clonostachys byssicola TaxID=160290 RepID=A0A9N9U118_9HYPO|nr:unnamed protein product [Clonostachys byssicola]